MMHALKERLRWLSSMLLPPKSALATASGSALRCVPQRSLPVGRNQKNLASGSTHTLPYCLHLDLTSLEAKHVTTVHSLACLTHITEAALPWGRAAKRWEHAQGLGASLAFNIMVGMRGAGKVPKHQGHLPEAEKLTCGWPRLNVKIPLH